MIEIIKWDGRRELLNREKIVKTLLRLGASRDLADKISIKIIKNLDKEISSKEILELIYIHLEENVPNICLQIDLRTAIGKMKSYPDFENYIRIILKNNGYEVKSNQLIRGRCTTHEIDGILEKDNKLIYLEIKHHSDFHNYTPFGDTLEAKAKFEDIKEGFNQGLNNINFDDILVITNTKLTDKAKEYAKCAKINHICWNEPENYNLETMIEKQKLFPISILKNLINNEYEILSKNNILTLKELLETSNIEGIFKDRLNKLREDALKIIEIREACEINI